MTPLDIVTPSYRDAILASPGLASYWRMGEILPTITIATLTDGAAAHDETPAVNEVQTVTVANAMTAGGTFTLTFGANTTSALQWNCTAAQMQTALTGLASIGSNNATVTRDGNTYTVTFVGDLAGANQSAMTYTSSLTTPSVVDSVGSVTGTVNGTVTRNFAAVIGSSLNGSIDFDGSSGYIDCGDNYDFAGVLPFSFMFWCSIDTLTNGKRFVTKNGAGVVGGWELIQTSSTGNVRFIRQDGASGSDNCDGTAVVVADGRSTQIAGTYDGSLMSQYVNGRLVGTKASTRSIVGNALTLKIGRQISAASNYFDGRMDEFAIWTRGLAASEVLDLYWTGRG